MGIIKQPRPVLLLIAAFSSSEEILQAGKQQMIQDFGPIWQESPTFRFDEFTLYYEKEMGKILFKRFWAFETLINPGTLPTIKRRTNQREAEIAELFKTDDSIPRPLNLDPGYIDLGKLILASTKDHSHRIYLNDGIFAETTLIFTKKHWQTLAWTYPDYQSNDYHHFFDKCRNYLYQKYQMTSEIEKGNGF